MNIINKVFLEYLNRNDNDEQVRDFYLKLKELLNTNEIKFHLDAYNDGSIDSRDLIQAIEEIVYN